MHPPDHRLKPLLYLLGAAVLWGTSFAATKIALAGFSPMAAVWLRMTIASIAFMPLWYRLPRPDYHPGDWKLLLLTSALMPCIYYICENYALKYTTSNQAGVISAITPLLVAGGAWLFLHERIGFRPMIAIAASLAGVVVLSLSGSFQTALDPVLGNTLEFLAMVCAAGWMLLMRRLSTRYNPWFITGMQAAVGAVFFLPAALASGPATWTSASPAAWTSIVFLGLFVSIGAFGLYNSALSLMSASRASLAVNLIPAIAVVTGWLVLGESLTLLQILACIAILGAVLFGESARNKRQAKTQSADSRTSPPSPGNKYV